MGRRLLSGCAAAALVLGFACPAGADSPNYLHRAEAEEALDRYAQKLAREMGAKWWDFEYKRRPGRSKRVMHYTLTMHDTGAFVPDEAPDQPSDVALTAAIGKRRNGKINVRSSLD